ncbi:MAG TPA: HepT-like ribonuclease domain-containing protein [Bryobacteraceae bacterium]|nr:HepT-like ribonuclease domain-containing protein [Bryobacteraceae bacterium]
MEKELLEAKLNQLLRILAETEHWLAIPLADFAKDTKLIRACQRNLQLLVEYASDINGILILESNQKVPGSYRESFTSLFEMDIASALSRTDREALLASVDWRNELIHEYEPEGSNDVFYATLKASLAAYRHYAQTIHRAVA